MGSLTRRLRALDRVPDRLKPNRGNSSHSISARAFGPPVTFSEPLPSLSDSMAALSLNVNDALADAFARDGVPRPAKVKVLGLEESNEFRRMIGEVEQATLQVVDQQRLLDLFGVQLTEAVSL